MSASSSMPRSWTIPVGGTCTRIPPVERCLADYFASGRYHLQNLINTHYWQLLCIKVHTTFMRVSSLVTKWVSYVPVFLYSTRFCNQALLFILNTMAIQLHLARGQEHRKYGLLVACHVRTVGVSPS